MAEEEMETSFWSHIVFRASGWTHAKERNIPRERKKIWPRIAMENRPLPKCLSSKIGEGKVQPDGQIECVSMKKKKMQNYKKKSRMKSVPTQMSFVRPKVFPHKYLTWLNLDGNLNLKRKVTNGWLWEYENCKTRIFWSRILPNKRFFENSLLPQFLVSSLHKSRVVCVHQYGLVQCMQPMKKHLTTMSFNAQ